MVVAFGLGSDSCLVRFLCSNVLFSGSNFYTRPKVFGLLRIYLNSGFCIGCILFIVL